MFQTCVNMQLLDAVHVTSSSIDLSVIFNFIQVGMKLTSEHPSPASSISLSGSIMTEIVLPSEKKNLVLARVWTILFALLQALVSQAEVELSW